MSLRSSEEVSGVKEGRAVGEAAEEKTELKLCVCVCVCVCVCARTHVCSRAQSCPALCSPMDGCPPGSSVHEILQARTLEWVAIASSRGSSQARDRTQVSCVFHIGRQILYLLRTPAHKGFIRCPKETRRSYRIFTVEFTCARRFFGCNILEGTELPGAPTCSGPGDQQV